MLHFTMLIIKPFIIQAISLNYNSNNHRIKPSSIRISTNNVNFYIKQQNKRTTNNAFRLSMIQNNDDNDNNNNNNDNKIIKIDDTRLFFGDIFVLILTAQLLGFVDAITAPDFFSNGGFFAPVPVVPTTLPILIQRISEMCISWISTSLYLQGYSTSTSSSSSDTTATTSNNITLKIFFYHCVLRLLFFIFFHWSSLSSSSSFLLDSTSFNNNDFLDLLRQFWFTFIFIFSFRYLYSSLYQKDTE